MTDLELSRSVGRMEAWIGEMREQQLEDAVEAKEHRSKVDDQIACMSKKLDAMHADVAMMKPVIERFRKVGTFTAAVFFVGAVFASALTLGREKLAAIANWLSS